MFDILKIHGYRVVHLTDGELLPEAVTFVDKGKAEGINLNYTLCLSADEKEVDFSAFPNLTSVALRWRPKAASLFRCTQLRHLFLGNYTESDLSQLSGLSNLNYLRINLGSVVSLKGFANMRKLEELLLMQATKLEDIDDILALECLKYLRIDNCKRVRNLGHIERMKIPRLEIVGTTPNDK